MSSLNVDRSTSGSRPASSSLLYVLPFRESHPPPSPSSGKRSPTSTVIHRRSPSRTLPSSSRLLTLAAEGPPLAATPAADLRKASRSRSKTDGNQRSVSPLPTLPYQHSRPNTTAAPAGHQAESSEFSLFEICTPPNRPPRAEQFLSIVPVLRSLSKCQGSTPHTPFFRNQDEKSGEEGRSKAEAERKSFSMASPNSSRMEDKSDLPSGSGIYMVRGSSVHEDTTRKSLRQLSQSYRQREKRMKEAKEGAWSFFVAMLDDAPPRTGVEASAMDELTSELPIRLGATVNDSCTGPLFPSILLENSASSTHHPYSLPVSTAVCAPPTSSSAGSPDFVSPNELSIPVPPSAGSPHPWSSFHHSKDSFNGPHRMLQSFATHASASSLGRHRDSLQSANGGPLNNSATPTGPPWTPEEALLHQAPYLTLYEQSEVRDYITLYYCGEAAVRKGLKRTPATTGSAVVLLHPHTRPVIAAQASVPTTSSPCASTTHRSVEAARRPHTSHSSPSAVIVEPLRKSASSRPLMHNELSKSLLPSILAEELSGGCAGSPANASPSNAGSPANASPSNAGSPANASPSNAGSSVCASVVEMCNSLQGSQQGPLRRDASFCGAYFPDFDDSEHFYQLIIGDHIAYRYEVVEAIGRGTFGVVVRALDWSTVADANEENRKPSLCALKIARNETLFAETAHEECALVGYVMEQLLLAVNPPSSPPAVETEENDKKEEDPIGSSYALECTQRPHPQPPIYISLRNSMSRQTDEVLIHSSGIPNHYNTPSPYTTTAPHSSNTAPPSPLFFSFNSGLPSPMATLVGPLSLTVGPPPGGVKIVADEAIDEPEEPPTGRALMEQRHLAPILNAFAFRQHEVLVFPLYGKNLRTVLGEGVLASHKPFTLGAKRLPRSLFTSPSGVPHYLNRSFTAQLLYAVGSLHEHGVWHMDLKPDNLVFADPSPPTSADAAEGDAPAPVPLKSKVILIDLGNAQRKVNPPVYPAQAALYRAPEVALHLPYDHSADMWSVGCVVFEMAFGVPLLKADVVDADGSPTAEAVLPSMPQQRQHVTTLATPAAAVSPPENTIQSIHVLSRAVEVLGFPDRRFTDELKSQWRSHLQTHPAMRGRWKQVMQEVKIGDWRHRLSTLSGCSTPRNSSAITEPSPVERAGVLAFYSSFTGPLTPRKAKVEVERHEERNRCVSVSAQGEDYVGGSYPWDPTPPRERSIEPSVSGGATRSRCSTATSCAVDLPLLTLLQKPAENSEQLIKMGGGPKEGDRGDPEEVEHCWLQFLTLLSAKTEDAKEAQTVTPMKKEQELSPREASGLALAQEEDPVGTARSGATTPSPSPQPVMFLSSSNGKSTLEAGFSRSNTSVDTTDTNPSLLSLLGIHELLQRMDFEAWEAQVYSEGVSPAPGHHTASEKRNEEEATPKKNNPTPAFLPLYHARPFALKGERAERHPKREGDTLLLLDFLLGCLYWNPGERLTAAEAAFHPWVSMFFDSDQEMRGAPTRCSGYHFLTIHPLTADYPEIAAAACRVAAVERFVCQTWWTDQPTSSMWIAPQHVDVSRFSFVLLPKLLEHRVVFPIPVLESNVAVRDPQQPDILHSKQQDTQSSVHIASASSPFFELFYQIQENEA